MQELVIIGIIAVLLFGRRLPEVAKSLGSSYREFRKGLTDLQSSIDFNDTKSSSSSSSYSSSDSPGYGETDYSEFDDHDEVSAPKFEPPPAEPQQAAEPSPSAEITKPISEK